MFTPENCELCKLCMGYNLCRGYIVTCTGREHCHGHADLKGTLESRKEDAITAFEESARRAQWGPVPFYQAVREYYEQEKREAKLVEAARAYNQGLGYIAVNHFFGSLFIYSGGEFDLKTVRDKAWKIR